MEWTQFIILKRPMGHVNLNIVFILNFNMNLIQYKCKKNAQSVL